MYRGTFKDLRDAGKKAVNLLKNSGYRHVVYGYTEKSTGDICVFTWDHEMHTFNTDKHFTEWLNNLDEDMDDITMIYAVHAI